MNLMVQLRNILIVFSYFNYEGKLQDLFDFFTNFKCRLNLNEMGSTDFVLIITRLKEINLDRFKVDLMIFHCIIQTKDLETGLVWCYHYLPFSSIVYSEVLWNLSFKLYFLI